MPNLETQSANIENKNTVSDIPENLVKFSEKINKSESQDLANRLGKSPLGRIIEGIKAKESAGKLPSVDALSNQYDALNKKVLEGANIIDTTEYKSNEVISKMLDSATKTGYTDLKITNVSTDTNGTILSVGSRGKKTSEKGVSEDAGVNFYRASTSTEFSSKDTTLVNEYYEGDTVVWADSPIKYNA